MSLSDLPDNEFDFNGIVHTPLENFDESQDSQTVAVMVSDPICSTNSTDSTDSSDSSDHRYREVLDNSTEDHKERHWIKIEDIDSEGQSSRARWLTELLDKLKSKWPESFTDNIHGWRTSLLRTSIVVSFSNSFLLVEHLKV